MDTDDYRGPIEIGYLALPKRGTVYLMDFEGRKIELYFTEKQRRLRVFVDGKEWKSE